MIDPEPLWLTVKLASATTAILLVIGIPLSYWLAYGHCRFRVIVEAVVSMPFVLPPSVLGFYLLSALSPAHNPGKFLHDVFGISLVFTFEGLVVASVIYSLPFMVNPLLAGFKQLPASLKEASYALGKSRLATMVKILLPNIRISLLTGIVMTFAHTIGEFGVVLMIGGNIPGATRVVSLAVYDEVQAMNYGAANVYAGILFAFSFVVLMTVFLLGNRSGARRSF